MNFSSNVVYSGKSHSNSQWNVELLTHLVLMLTGELAVQQDVPQRGSGLLKK